MEEIIVVGRLSMGTPFLAKTDKGILYTPAVYIDDNYNISNADNVSNNKFYIYREGYEELFQTEKCDLDLCSYKHLSLAVKEANKTKWIKIRAYGNLAKDIHLDYSKGDLVRAKLQRQNTLEEVWLVVGIGKKL